MLEVEWIPRVKNEYADTISRITDYDDWGIDPAIFGILDIAWGPHIVDCFASPYTHMSLFIQFLTTNNYYGAICMLVATFVCTQLYSCN